MRKQLVVARNNSAAPTKETIVGDDDSDMGENPDKQCENKVTVKVPDLDENDCQKLHPKTGKPMYKWITREATAEELGFDPNDQNLPPVTPTYDFDGNEQRRRELSFKVIKKMR